MIELLALVVKVGIVIYLLLFVAFGIGEIFSTRRLRRKYPSN